MTDDLVARLREATQWQFKTESTLYGEAADRIETLEAALQSIAANTCCDKCHQAALVARAALEGKDD